MSKICLQAGHMNMKAGATGAPGERDWTTKITPMIAERLKNAGYETYVADAFANTDKNVTGKDWDLFISLHYDADIYKDSGGFVDFPDASVDMVNTTSKKYASIISDHYFTTTKIKNVPRRSNANTKFYYMWSALTAKTPCVIIECGVGFRRPDDFEILRKYDFIADTIAMAIRKCFESEVEKPSTCEQELKEMRVSRNKWKKDYENLKDVFTALENKYDSLNITYAKLVSEHKKCGAGINSHTEEINVLKGQISALEMKLKELTRLQEENKKLTEKLEQGLEKFNIMELVSIILKKLKL